jgi:hypothetical protein
VCPAPAKAADPERQHAQPPHEKLYVCGEVRSIAARVASVADAARKTGIYASPRAFASLLVGAFAASYMATVGGAAATRL